METIINITENDLYLYFKTVRKSLIREFWRKTITKNMSSSLSDEFKDKFNDLVTLDNIHYYFEAENASNELNNYLKQYIFKLSTNEDTQNK